MSKQFLQVLQTLTQQMLFQEVCVFCLPLPLAFELVLEVPTEKSEGCVNRIYLVPDLSLMPLLPREGSPSMCTADSTVPSSVDPTRRCKGTGGTDEQWDRCVHETSNYFVPGSETLDHLSHSQTHQNCLTFDPHPIPV